MNEEVYIVTTGEYSDYGIMAVFSTEIAALNYCALGGKYSDRRVEVYPLDELDEEVRAPEGRVYEFSAAVLYDRGSRRFELYTEVVEREPTASVRASAPRCETESEPSTNSCGDRVHNLKVYGTDYERVRKVYDEKLAELKARIKGIA